MKHSNKKVVALVLAMMMILSSLTVVAAGRELVVDAGESYVVTTTTNLNSLTIEDGASVVAADGYLLTMVVNGVEKAVEEGVYEGYIDLVLTEDYSDEVIGSFSGRGGEEFRTAIYVDENGINYDRSVTETLVGGRTSGAVADGVSITGESENFNGIIITGAEYEISNASIYLDGQGDGIDGNGEPNVSDFSGLGSAIAAYDDAVVTLDNVNIFTSGVARPAVFSDAGSDVLVTDSRITSIGGELHDDYINTANQYYMVAPPWVLGITGNARTTNLMGTCSTMTVVNTEAIANQWGVLSTDSGSDMVLTVVDTTMTLEGNNQEDPFSENYGSGYGTYIIGDAQEYFYGVTMNVGTYGSILTGGDAIYASSNFDEELDIYPLVQIPTGTYETDFMGNEVEVTIAEQADEAVFTGIEGQGKNTVINSDAFGFMAHNSGSLTITDGTEVNTDNATFLMKSGDVDIVVSDQAKIRTEDGIILQMIDNDDSLVGASMEGDYAPAFNTTFSETEGYPGIDYEVEVSSVGQNTYNFMATDVVLKGDLYNGTGYYGGQAADQLNVNIGSGATLSGDIAATSVVHVNEFGEQNTYFTIDEYYYLGHVGNQAYYNGGNDINVNLVQGGNWIVEDYSLITSLTIDATSSISVAPGRNLAVYVDGSEVVIEPDTDYSLEGVIELVVSIKAQSEEGKDNNQSKVKESKNK